MTVLRWLNSSSSAPSMALATSSSRQAQRVAAPRAVTGATAKASTLNALRPSSSPSSNKFRWRRQAPSLLLSPSPRNASLCPPKGLGSDAGDDAYVTSEEELNSVLSSADVVVVDFMARWCRKCIYVKPRIATLLKEKFPQVPLAFVDVNAVPSSVVVGAGVTKMPTVVVYVKGKAVESYVAGESATTAVLKVEEMVKKGLAEGKKAKEAKV